MKKEEQNEVRTI